MHDQPAFTHARSYLVNLVQQVERRRVAPLDREDERKRDDCLLTA
jgi:hypothetical protein